MPPPSVTKGEAETRPHWESLKRHRGRFGGGWVLPKRWGTRAHHVGLQKATTPSCYWARPHTLHSLQPALHIFSRIMVVFLVLSSSMLNKEDCYHLICWFLPHLSHSALTKRAAGPFPAQ